MDFKLLAEGPGYQIAHVGSLLLTTHTLAATVGMVEALDDAMATHRRTFPRFPVLAMVAGSGIRTPEPGIKDRVVAQEKRFESAITSAAVAIEARGLPAVLTRGFLVAYTLVSSHKFPLQSFGTLEAGVAWLQSVVGQEASFVSDVTAAAEARKLLDRVSPAAQAA